MLRINIVYQNKNMPGDVLPVIEASDRSYSVIWSRNVQADSDIVVYFNHYTYSAKKHRKVCPSALKVLYMYEPTAVDPVQYTRAIWKKFDALLTWNTYLTDASVFFTFEAGAYYDLPYCSDYGVPALTDWSDLGQREKAICQICGDKYSLSADEIYSKRREVARWFYANAKTRMDVFGRPAMEVPNYRGECEKKEMIFRKYRYALCFENTFHPQWTQGYLTEKILDCMASHTIPVYYGCSNIEELVPSDCFIDFREYASLQELDEYLQAMSDDEYLGYAQRMQEFYNSYNAPQRHSAERLYETILETASKECSGQQLKYPADYLDFSSFTGKIRFYAMWLLLPYHRLIYPAFSMVRSFCRVR